MTEERKELIARFQSWLDTDPRKQIIAAQCANIAEEYAENKLEELAIANVVNHICPCCGSDKTYVTDAIHCNMCAVTTEI